jgi:hypothetical protein
MPEDESREAQANEQAEEAEAATEAALDLQGVFIIYQSSVTDLVEVMTARTPKEAAAKIAKLDEEVPFLFVVQGTELNVRVQQTFEVELGGESFHVGSVSRGTYVD